MNSEIFFRHYDDETAHQASEKISEIMNAINAEVSEFYGKPLEEITDRDDIDGDKQTYAQIMYLASQGIKPEWVACAAHILSQLGMRTLTEKEDMESMSPEEAQQAVIYSVMWPIGMALMIGHRIGREAFNAIV